MSTIQPISGTDLNATALAPGVAALDFYQASCAPCRALEPQLERIAAQYTKRVAVYRIDIDRDMPVADRFNVKSIPTILLLKDGQEVERLDGLITQAQLSAAFDRLGQT